MLFDEKFVSALVNSVVFWLLALVFISVSYCMLDKIILRGIHFSDELRKGNVAVAIVIAAFLGAIGLVIFGVTN